MSPNDSALRDTIARLNRDGGQAMVNRRPADACRLLTEALRLDPSLMAVRMNLATAQRMSGDLAGALASVDAGLALTPLFFPALLMRGSLLEMMGRSRQAADAYNIALVHRPPEDTLDPATRRAVAHALDFHAKHRREMNSFVRQAIHAGALSGASAPIRRLQGFLDHMLTGRPVYRSEPTNLFYPGLPSIEIYDRDDFPWLPDLEAATPIIQAELRGVLADEAAAQGIEPYTQRPEGEPLGQWSELNHSPRWSAYHFAFYGKLYEDHRRTCPKTVALLDQLPQPQVPNRSPASMFSILQPKTHIPAHRGAANFRLLCHLPLILPPDCRIRVGSITRQWTMGEGFVFDDTIEHEAWNDSDQMRAVLIFDIWHPQLTEDEREIITQSLIALDRFNESEPSR